MLQKQPFRNRGLQFEKHKLHQFKNAVRVMEDRYNKNTKWRPEKTAQ
jgi:hypothetical protein